MYFMFIEKYMCVAHENHAFLARPYLVIILQNVGKLFRSLEMQCCSSLDICCGFLHAVNVKPQTFLIIQ